MKILISENQLKLLILEQSTGKLSYTVGKFNLPCKVEYQNELRRAKEFWENWLTHPITKEKITKIHKFKSIEETDKLVKKYISTLNKIRLLFFDSEKKVMDEEVIDYAGDPEEFYKYSKDKMAFTNWMYEKYVIYVNCGVNNPNKVNTLVHEIQHILYNIKPINPHKKIGAAFISKDQKVGSYLDVLSSQFKNIKKSDDIEDFKFSDLQNKNLKTVLRSLGVTTNDGFNYYGKIYKTIIKNNSNMIVKDKTLMDVNRAYYNCDEDEKMSNIFAARLLFNLKPSDKITKEMLKPYILFKKQNNDISYLLLCWALNGFKDLDQFLNEINDLAFKQQKENKFKDQLT